MEYTQFEDDDYYYYVKAVPKIKIAAPKKDVKRINGENADSALEEQVEPEWAQDEEIQR